MKLVEIITKRVERLDDIIIQEETFYQNRTGTKKTVSNTKVKMLESLHKSYSKILTLYQTISENLPECRTVPETFYFSPGKPSTVDREIVATALTHFRRNEEQKVAILTRDHDIMRLLLGHYKKQARARKEDLNDRLHIHFVSRKDPLLAVRIQPATYLQGNCW